MKKITSLVGTGGGCETMPMRGPSVGGGWSSWMVTLDSIVGFVGPRNSTVDEGTDHPHPHQASAL
jgi:hypothetical protein